MGLVFYGNVRQSQTEDKARLRLASSLSVARQFQHGGVVPAEGVNERVAGRLEVTHRHLARFLALHTCLRFTYLRCLDCFCLRHRKEATSTTSLAVNPWRRCNSLPVVDPPAHPGAARNLPLSRGVLYAQVASALLAAQ